VYDVGTTGGAIPYIVMERLRGHDLAHELRTRRQLGLGETREIVAQVAAGLEAARKQGIVHRDLKPNNVFCTDLSGTPVYKLLDFGVSKLGDSGTLTGGHILGTPGYMAPEQARAEEVDHRADVYSLAAIAYRAVTGYPAFAGKDLAATLMQVLNRMPTRPSKLALVATDVDRVLALGLAKDPNDRIQTAIEFAAWFAAAIDANLDAAQRRRGDEQIARAPWGAEIPSAVES